MNTATQTINITLESLVDRYPNLISIIHSDYFNEYLFKFKCLKCGEEFDIFLKHIETEEYHKHCFRCRIVEIKDKPLTEEEIKDNRIKREIRKNEDLVKEQREYDESIKDERMKHNYYSGNLWDYDDGKIKDCVTEIKRGIRYKSLISNGR
jgi:hypothetical protein